MSRSSQWRNAVVKPFRSDPSGQPIRKFARFFKAYNVGLSLLLAAIPVLIGVWDVVPFYANSKNQLTLVTSVGSYLLVGFIFSQRINIARLYFPRGGKARAVLSRDLRKSQWFGRFPLALAALSVICFYLYFHTINNSIEVIAYENAVSKPASGDILKNSSVCESLSLAPETSVVVPAEFIAFGIRAQVAIRCKSGPASVIDKDRKPELDYTVGLPDQAIVSSILKNAPSPSIPYSFWASVCFLGAFLSATSAFILMGLKEYIQEDLGLKDEDLIYYPVGSTVEKRFDIEGVPGLYGVIEFSPADPTLAPRVEGPYCTWHNLKPTPENFDDKATVTRWIHVSVKDGKQVVVTCSLMTPLSEGELQTRLENGANQVIARLRMENSIAAAD
jgi:hypothetical protein